MSEMRLAYPVSLLGCMLRVSPSGYYAWVVRPLSNRAREELRLELEIKAAHQRTRQTYGPERLQHDLAGHGLNVSARSSAFAAGRSGNSKQLRIPGIRCPW
jgi:putative transposase